MRSTGVRLSSPPPLEPPFDDELAPNAWPISPYLGTQLTFDWEASPYVEPVVEVEENPADATVSASPAVRQATRKLLERCLEIFNGYRPAGHIRPMTSPLYAQPVVEQVAAVARRTILTHRAATAAGRPSGAQAGRPGAPAGRATGVTCRRVRVTEPQPGAAEGMAVLAQSGRSWAVAFRLEQRRNTWLCTTFIDITPPDPRSAKPAGRTPQVPAR